MEDKNIKLIIIIAAIVVILFFLLIPFGEPPKSILQTIIDGLGHWLSDLGHWFSRVFG